MEKFRRPAKWPRIGQNWGRAARNRGGDDGWGEGLRRARAAAGRAGEREQMKHARWERQMAPTLRRPARPRPHERVERDFGPFFARSAGVGKDINMFSTDFVENSVDRWKSRREIGTAREFGVSSPPLARCILNVVLDLSRRRDPSCGSRGRTGIEGIRGNPRDLRPASP